MNKKPTEIYGCDGGPSYAAFVYEMQAIHLKLDVLVAAADKHGILKAFIEHQDEGRLS
jgi:hypothetical protein